MTDPTDEHVEPADEFPHLHRDVRTMVLASKQERINFALKDKWVGYPAAKRVLDRLADLMGRPVTVRSRGILLAARSDNGKSSLLARFAKQNPPRTTEDGETVNDFVLMSMPDQPTEEKFWSAALTGMRIAHDVRNPAKVLKQRAQQVLSVQKVRLLGIDDIHNTLQGTARQQSHALVLLKILAESLKLHLLVAGTETAITAMSTDDQVGTRYGLEILPPWQENDTLRSLLSGLEETLPLAMPSDLASKPMLRALKAKSYDTIGGYVHTAQLATELAIKRGCDRLTPALVDAVDWTPLVSLPHGKKVDI